jgi:ABC-type glycerol-3-phosphate transport system substrate-binding protein
MKRFKQVSSPNRASGRAPWEVLMRFAKRWRPLSLLAAAVVCILALGACSAGSLGSSDKGGGTTLNFLVDNSEGSTKPAQGLAEAFHAKNPDITVQVQTRPGGAEGDTSSRRGSPRAR